MSIQKLTAHLLVKIAIIGECSVMQKLLKFFWVIPKSCVGGPKSKKAVGNNIVLFESLCNNYPSLGNLKIQ